MRRCAICHWQKATRKGRCNACRLFLYRHGRDKTPAEIAIGWNRAIDKVGRITFPHVVKVNYKS